MGSSCCKEESEKIEKLEKIEKSEKVEEPVPKRKPWWDDRKPVDISPIAKALNKLAVDLFTKINSDRSNENIFFSPLSIALALALVETGATGKTQEEIQKVIKPIGEDAECGKLYGELQETILNCAKLGGQFNIANSIFHDNSMVIQETFLKNVKDWLKTEILPAPFSSNSPTACQQINQWISDKTAKKIPHLLGELSGDTACVLVNAISMKMDWLVKFPVEKTNYRSFYRFGGKEEQIAKFMRGEDPYYATQEGLQIIEMPYKGEDTSMYVILPRRRDGIKDIENKLSVDFLLQAMTDLRPTSDLQVEIPKFTVRFQTSLLDVFAKLGFINHRELGRMSNDPRLVISKALHESYIKVDESGTDAIPLTFKVPFSEPVKEFFIADHPFLFFIVHKPTWAIVFMGKINYVENKE